MSCRIQKNSLGEVVKVLNNEGKVSKLYKEIARHPLIEDALPTYLNVFGDKYSKVPESQIDFTHKVGDLETKSFKEALSLAVEGSEIKIGFKMGEKFDNLLTIVRNTQRNTVTGFTQAEILDGTLSEIRDSSGSLQAEGRTNNRKVASLGVLVNRATKTLGFDAITVEGTTVKLSEPTRGTFKVYVGGKEQTVKTEELKGMSLEAIRAKFDNPTPIIAEKVLQENVPMVRGTDLKVWADLKEDSEVAKNLLNLLNKMGITVTSMDNYVKNYTLRHGVHPKAEALADIANQVIGVVAGNESVENLAEETAHFIVEALPQERIENILRNIDKTEEYKEHYATQRAIYEAEYSGEELENVVRREILGKIIKNVISKEDLKPSGFIQATIKLITDFFDSVANYFRAEHVQELNSLLKDVQEIVDSQDISKLELANFSGNEGRFYNAREDSALAKESLRNIGILLKLEKDLNKTSKGNASSIIDLQHAQKQLEKEYDTHALAKVGSIAESTVKVLEAALKDSKDSGKSYDLSNEENVVYANLVGEVKKGLGVLKELLETKEAPTKVENYLAKSFGDTIAKISSLEAKRTVVHNTSLEKMFRAVTTDKGLPESEFENMMRWADRAEKDTNWALKTFGTLVNSSDALANIYASKRTAMFNRHSQASHFQTKQLQADLEKYGKDEKYVSSLVKDGYFVSELDIPAWKKKLEKNFLETYRKIIPTSKESDEDLLKRRLNNTLRWTLDEQLTVEAEVYILDRADSENRMEEAYYEDLEKKYLTAKTSETTKDTLRALNSQKSRIQAKVVDKDGRIDLTKLSSQDLTALQLLNKKRATLKSPVDLDGKVKEGLEFKTNSEGRQELSLKIPLEDLNESSRTAYDIFVLDNGGNVLKRGDTRPQAFDDLVLSKAEREDQVRTLELNSSLSFSQEFWDSLGNLQGIKDKLLDVRNSNNSQEIDILIDRLAELKAREKALNKLHVMPSNPSETNVEDMSVQAKDSVRSISEETEELMVRARELSKDHTLEIEDFESQGISGANQAWEDATHDLGVSEVLTFAKQHSTKRNSEAISDAEYNVRAFRTGKIVKLSKSVENALEKQGLTKKSLNDEVVANQFLKVYAEGRLLSYYRRFTPQSYLDFKADLENESIPVSEILSKEYKYLEINPNYSFSEEDTTQINPKYIRNSRMGFSQPSRAKFENKDFTEKFGKVVRDHKGNYVSSEKNSKEFEAYKAVMNFRFNQIDLMEGGNGYNAYQAPPARKQMVERFAGGISVKGIKNYLEELTTYTEDDQIKGDNSLGANNKIIPRQFFHPLENESDRSDDIFHSLIITNNAANLYKARVDFYGDFMAIQDYARNRFTEGSTVETSATNRFQTIESAIDNDVYGIKQISDTKFAKGIDSLGAFLRFKGLGGSIIIPLTAYLTGKTKQTVERWVGQYINKDSFERGSKAYHENFSKAMRETGNLHSKSEMNVKGEYWQAFELESRLYGSKYGKFARLLSRSHMILFGAANYPIYGKNMYNVLHDFRVVNGQIMKFTDFKRARQTENLDISQQAIQAEWAAVKKTVNDLHSVNDNGQVVWDKAQLKSLVGQNMTEEELDDYILKISDDVRIQIKNLNIRADMQLSHEDKVAANRHYLLNFLMAFKGYLIPLYEERMKGTKYNIQSRQVEGGSYSGIYELGRDIIKAWDANGGSFMQAFKSQWNGDYTEARERIEILKANNNRTSEQDLELKTLTEELVRDMEFAELRHSNMKRLAIDLLVVNGLIAIMMLVRGFADDDEDNYGLQMAHMLSQRLTNEVNSANLNIVSNYYDVVEAPLSGFRILTDVAKLPKAWEKGETLQQIGKSWIPFYNSIQQMINPAKAADSMRYYSEVEGNDYMLSPIYHLMNK